MPGPEQDRDEASRVRARLEELKRRAAKDELDTVAESLAKVERGAAAMLPRLGLFPPTLERVRLALGELANLAPEEELATMPVEAMRDELARELTYAINGAGAYATLEVLELARAIRDLSESYVRLGGELAIPVPSPAPPRLNLADVDLLERVRALAWSAVNELGGSTALADDVAARLINDLELEAEAGR